jgi:hypothetical protein
MKKTILSIEGTLNQITQLHQIAQEMPEHDCRFSAQYCDGVLGAVSHWGGCFSPHPAGLG